MSGPTRRVAGLVCGILLIPAVAWAVDPALDQYNYATGLFNRGRFKLAAGEYQAFLAKYPTHTKAGDAQFFLAQSHFELKDYARALAAYQATVAKYASSKHIAETRYRVGECLVLLKRFKEAAPAFNAYLAAHKKHNLREYGLYLLGESLLREGRHADAAKAYAQQLAEWPKSTLRVRCTFSLGECYYAVNDHAKAASAYEQVVAAKKPANLVHSSLLGLGLARYQLKDYARARAAFEALLKAAPKGPLADQARMNLGMTLYLLGQYPLATDTLAPLGRGKTDLADDALYWAALAHIKAGRPAAAAPLLVKAVKMPKSNLAPDIAYHLADVHLSMKKYAQAATYFQAFLKAHGSHDLADEALYSLTYSVYAQDKFKEARDHALAYLKRHGSAPLAGEVRFLLGNSQSALKDYDGAIKTFAALTKTSKDSALEAAYLNLARNHYLKKEWPQALGALDKMKAPSASDPQAATARFIAGECAFAVDDHGRTVKEFAALLKADPKTRFLDVALLKTALSHLKLRAPDKATAAFKRLIAEAPKSPYVIQAHYQLAELAFAVKNYKTAAAEHDAVVKGDAKSRYHPLSLQGAAWCAYLQKDLAGAASLFARTAATHPKHALAAEARYMHGRSLHEAGKHAEAIPVLTAFVAANAKDGNAFDASFRIGQCHTALKKYRQAAAAFDTTLKQFATHEEIDKALYEQGWAYMQDKNETAAMQVFARLVKEQPKSRLVGDALFRLGKHRVDRSDFAGALPHLKTLVGKHLTRDLEEPALYLLGKCYWKTDKVAETVTTFERLVKSRPKSTYGAEALFLIGEAHVKQKKYVEAANAFDRMVKGFPKDDWCSEAYFRMADCYVQAADWPKVLATTGTLKQKYPKFDRMYEVDFRRGRAYQNTSKAAEAIAAYKAVVSAFEGETAAKAQFMIGEVLFHQAKHAEALKAFLKVEILYDYKVWRAAALLEAGKCQEHLNQWADAKKTYDDLLKNYADSAAAEDAKKRLQIVIAKLNGKPAG